MNILWLGIFFLFQEALICQTQVNAYDKRMSNGSDSLKPKEQFDMKLNYGTRSNIISKDEHIRLLRILKQEEEKEIQARLKQEKEDEVYRKYLASRIRSSISRDFLTMRF